MKKKNRILIYSLVVMGVLLMLTNSCKKKDDDSPTPTGDVPVLSSIAIINITQATAYCRSNITSDGGSTVTVRGLCWSTNQTPTLSDNFIDDGTGTGIFSITISGLSASTTYYVRAYATNSIGTGYGSVISFITASGPVPVLTTNKISDITTNSATCGGNISSDGGNTVISRGVCWNTNTLPTISDNKTTDSSGIGSFPSNITGLSVNTIYYVRAYAANSAGISYGNEFIFKTYTGTVTDIDSNVYNTITIGTQVWMVENLKTTKYRDGTDIPNVTVDTVWNILTTGAYCDYNNTPSNSVTYGRLYNWYAATDAHNICPTGWHIPTDAEWTTLTTYLGGENVAGGKLSTDWNIIGTNESGFTALPGGHRSINGSFYDKGYDAYWWSSTEEGTGDAWYRLVHYYNSHAGRNNNGKPTGFSVRCVRN
ncbi:MAG: hypothetical protein A2X08_15045 [Bacteroidetes bacterium GWA2_32_17]|nr:MAG: hypothetical protein A2X08_15045 [Bacteroidetes bacterium GWA2_32_17]